MKTKNNQTGSTQLVLLIVFFVISLIGYVGWKILQNDGQYKKYRAETIEQGTSDDEGAINSGSRFYKLELPTGWVTRVNRTLKYGSDESYTYKDNAGKELTIYVNADTSNSSGADQSITYTVSNNRILLEDISKIKLCNLADSNPYCMAENNKLEIFVSSSSKIKDNNYYFEFNDNKTEDLNSLTTVKSIIESMRFN
jgi:hypothetical protein